MPGTLTVLWIIAGSILTVLACLAIVWWAVYRLNQERQTAVEQQTASIGLLLKRARDAQDEIDQEIQIYPDEPPPFYRPTLITLIRSRESAAQAIVQHTHTFNQLRVRMAPAPDHLLRRWFTVLGAERHFWRDQSKAAQTLERLVREQVMGGLAHSRELLRELRAKPLAIAQNARELRDRLDQALRLAADMQRSGLHGETFLAQYTQLQTCRQQFDEQPISFFVQNAEATIMRHAGLYDVQQVCDALARIQDPSLAASELLHTWQTWHHEFERALQELEYVQQQVALRLRATPPSLDVSNLSAARDTHFAPAPRLIALFASPTVENLQQIEHVLQIVEAGHELIRHITQIESRYWYLCELIQAMVSALTQVQAIMIETSQANAYPLAWAEYPIVFSQLAQKLTQIGVLDTPRPPDRLEQDVQRASDLSQQVEGRRAEVDHIFEQYQALVLLLNRPELNPDRGWFEWATRLQQQSSVYASQNWHRKLAVEHLQGDIAALEKQWRQWVPETPHEQIPVVQIEQRVEQVTQLGEELARFSERLEQVETQLLAMQQAETSALEQLEQAEQILKQFEQLTANTQPPLSETLSRHRHQVLDYRRSQRDQIKMLERKDRSRVAHQVAQVGKWTSALSGALTAWSNALRDDVAQFEQQLNNELERLHEVAPFDAEQVMAEALKLVVARPSHGSSHSTTRLKNVQAIPMATQIEQTQTSLQKREQLACAHQDVRHHLWTPIEKLAHLVNETRQEALERFETVQALAYEQSNRSDWPFPSDTQVIATMLDDAMRQENRLRDNGSKVARVTQWLTDIAAQYRQIIDQAKSDLESIGSKRQRLDHILAQIEAWQADLEVYRRHTDDREIDRGIRARLDQIDGELDRLRRKTRGRRLISYEELADQLEQIEARAYTAVPYGSGSDSIPVDVIESRNHRGRRHRGRL
ncbi:MAG: hypothetical protein JXA89_15510 [Anaerolineae bacterium]|nr:hypothetical protein [Anaerolineae bacterium]